MAQWRDHRFVRSIINATLSKHGELTASNVREHLYTTWKECTQFKPSLAVSVIKFFKAKRVLDFSAGWGDRLAGAIAANVDRYTAYDPNTSLTQGHSAIISSYVAADRRGDYTVTYTGFEGATVPHQDYDLVFTSPPFFDFEIYTSLPGQSVDTYKSLNSWMVDFLFACLKKAWDALQINGHIVIHITDVFKTKVCERMCLLVTWQLRGAHYRGVLNSVGFVGKPRPMWVFRKQAPSDDDDSIQRDAEQQLKYIYRDTYEYAVRALTQSTVK